MTITTAFIGVVALAASGLLYAAQDTAGQDGAGNDAPTQLIIGQIIIFLGTLAGIVLTLIKDKRAAAAAERKRLWDVEDAKAAAVQREQDRKNERDEHERELAEAAALRKHQTELIVERARADAEALRITVEARAEALRIETAAIAEKMRIEATAAAADFRKKADLIEHKLDEVHQVASDAKHEAQAAVVEANHVNEKIASMIELFGGDPYHPSGEVSETVQAIKDIDETTQRTDATVTVIQETLGNASADKNTS